MALHFTVEPLIDRCGYPEREPTELPPGLQLSFHPTTREQQHRNRGSWNRRRSSSRPKGASGAGSPVRLAGVPSSGVIRDS